MKPFFFLLILGIAYTGAAAAQTKTACSDFTCLPVPEPQAPATPSPRPPSAPQDECAQFGRGCPQPGPRPNNGGGNSGSIYHPHQQPQPRPEQPRRPSRAELRRAEEAAKRDAVQRQHIQAELHRLTTNLQVHQIQSTIELRPRSDGSFGITPSDEQPFGAILAARLSGKGTPASRIPTENLRRAAAVLAPVMESVRKGSAGNMSDEDMSFLAGQAALAMEGAPLSVVVTGSTGKEEQARQVAQQAEYLEAAQEAAQQAHDERLRLETTLINVQRDLKAGKGDTKALIGERDELAASYKSALKTEKDKKEEVRKRASTVTEVWETAPSNR